MSDYTSNTTLAEIAERLRGARRVLLTTHAKPDGDAMGSVLAVARALAGDERAVDLQLTGPVMPCLAELASPTPFRLNETAPPTGDYDAAVVLDTGAWSQLDGIADWLREHRDIVIVIDHHARGDDVGAMRYVDTDAAATTQILVELIDELGVALDRGIAEPLFAGLATDTGWFRFSSADSKTFAAASRLLACGVDKAGLYQQIEETYRIERLAIQARALASLELVGDVAIMSLPREAFEATGATLEDLTGIVNEPMVVGEVRASVLLTQTDAGVTKLSFRSKPAKPGADAEDFIDVNEMASRYGGGGHRNAAGARVQAPIDEVRARLVDELRS